MDKLRFILLFAVVLLAGNAAAYDFESGGLYYNILDADAKTVEVTSGGDGVTYSATVVIPRSVAFDGITYMVKGIGENAFNNHYEIHSLSIADGIETIAYRAVASCPNLSELLLPSTLKSIGVSAFNYTHIKNPVLPEGLESIGNNAFSSCYNLTKVTLPSTLTSLGSNIFGGSRLSAVVSHIQEPSAIGNDVFNTGNDNHLTLYVPSGTKSAYGSKAGWNIFNKIYEGEPLEVNVNGINYRYFDDSNEAIVIDGDYSNMESVTIPGSIPIYGTNYFVKEVGPAAFYYYNNIKTIVIEEGVEIINNAAFDQCTSITSIQFPSTLKTIGNSAFASCNQGPDIILPEGLESIGGGAFHWSNSKKIVLPSSLKSIGSGAFRHINNSASVTSYIQEPFAIDKNVFAYEDYWQDGVEVISYPQATLYVPEGTSEKYKALEGWNVFSEILEGEKKTYSYGGLIYSYIESDKTAKVIGRSDETLRDVIIPATVSIGDNTYAVKAIGGGAFYDISLNSVVIEDGIETIESEAFWDSDGINKLVLPSTLKSIGDRAFTWAYISKLDLPEGLVRIGHNAFNSCGNLKKVTLPSSLTEIGNNVFSNCNNLSAIISHIQVPFDVDENVFYSNSSATLYVPEGTKAAYEALNGWNKFADIVEGELYEETVDGVIYSYNKSAQTATVVGGDFSDYRKVTILGSVLIDGVDYAVKTIASGAFRNNYYIDSLIISSGIEVIEKNAFYNCYRMRYVELPSTLTTIGEYAFAYCGNMQNLVLPSSLTSIGEFAFTNNNLTNVTSRIQSPFEINKSVFCRYESYWDATEQKNVETYTNPNATLYVPIGTKSAYEAIEGWSVFPEIVEGEIKETTYNGLNYRYVEGKGEATVISGDYSQITKLTIPGSIEVEGVSYIVKAIDNYVFSNCYSLDTLIIENGVERIGQNAFYNCSNMKSVSLPTSLKSIGESSFAECNNITSLVIPEGVKTIGQNAFSWCNNMKLLELPSTLDSIGDYAFRRCYNLSRVVSRIKTPFKISKSVFCYEDYWENNAQVFRNSPATLYVPTGTKSAYEAYEGWNMFDGGIYEGDPKEGKSGIYSYIYMTDSKTATMVGADNIDQNTLELPATVVFDGDSYNVVGIGNEVFQSRYMKSVIIPDGYETIGKRAFYECYSLRSVKLPNSITSIGDDAFQNCNVLDTISIPSNIKSIGYNAFWATKITEVKIPATTTYIGRNAFAYCEQLRSISVDSKNSAYDSRNNCNALIEKATNTLMRGCGTTIIPNTVQIIGQHAFAGCLNLSDASIPNSVTTIEDNAFSNCRALTSVVIPSSVTKLYQQSFSGCSSLKSIRVDENNRTYDSRNNCNAVIETATKTLMIGCQSTIIPKGITSIADRSFHSCEKLDSIKIPYGVTYIGEYAFYNCSGLVYVEIPNSVQTLRYGAFENCNNIQTVVSKIKDPEGMNQMEWAFSGSYGSATLFVPNGTKQAYKNRYGWDNFYYIEEMIGDPLAAPTLTYDGRAITATAPETDVDMYYSTDDFNTVNYYEGPITVSDLGTVKVIAEKTFRSDSEAAAYEVKYLYDGDTLKLAEAGLMAEAIKWCGTDSVVKMTVVGPISTDEFSTISTLPNLKFLNLADAKVDGASLPDGAFANSQIVSFVSPSSLSSVGSGIFRDCQQLAAVCWKASTALPADALSGVSNPNLLLYVNSEYQAPEGINNVVVDGKAKSITLTDATGNSNFYVPVAFHVTDTIKYTRNFQQKTQPGVSCGWETIVLPFNVKKITHETISNVTITPFADYNGWDNQRPFWLYTLDNNDIRPAYGIDANVPYLICMPNADEYGDQYNLAGNVTFSAANVDIAVSKPIEEAQGDITFVPTYQSVPVSTDVFTLNVNEEYKGYPAGSLFVSNFRDVRPFEAYSIHPSAVAKKVNEARMYTVSSLIGGDTGTTGIIDVMLKKNDGANSDAVVKVYSLSGALIKQGKVEDVTNGLPKGVYVANGKKFVVK